MNNHANISTQLNTAIKNELDRGEVIKWLSKPQPRFFSPKVRGVFLFAFPWTAFSLYWMIIAGQSDNILFTMIGLPFLLIGLGMLLTPVWSYYKSTKTAYVITNKRAITFEGGISVTIRSYTPEKLHNIYRVERKNGVGDVIISFREWRDSRGAVRKEELGFLNIKNPHDIEKQLNALAKQNP